jgi:hypothetical protein
MKNSVKWLLELLKQPVKFLDSSVPSTLSSNQVKPGTTPTEIQLHDDTKAVIVVAYLNGFSTKSNLAREQATHVACAASLGLITTALPDGKFGNIWRVTPKGISMFFNEGEFS